MLPAVTVPALAPPKLALFRIVMTSVLLEVPNVVVIITQPLTAVVVVKLKLVLEAPVAIAIVDGSVNAALLLDRPSLNPPGLGLLSLTMHDPELPGLTLMGAHVTEDNVGASAKVIAITCEVPFNVAVMWAVAAAVKTVA